MHSEVLESLSVVCMSLLNLIQLNLAPWLRHLTCHTVELSGENSVPSTAQRIMSESGKWSRDGRAGGGFKRGGS